MGASEELIACRVCLAAGGRLFAISGSRLEEALAAHTGLTMPEDGFPRHLCVFCVAKLSNCAAFRDSCWRSTALLRTLAERGPLTMNDINAVDRQTHKLTNRLAPAKVYHFQTNPFLDMIPLLIKRDDDSQQVPDYTEIEYLDSDGDIEYLDTNITNGTEEENSLEENNIKIELEIVSDAHSEIDDDDDVEYKVGSDISEAETDTSEEKLAAVKKTGESVTRQENTDKYTKICKNVKSKNYPSDVDSDTSEEIIEMRERVRIKKLTLKSSSNKEVTLVKHRESLTAFEKEFDCKIKLLSKEEQRREIEERISNNKSKYCCNLCGKGYRSENAIMTHLTYHDESLQHGCEACGLRFRSRPRLLKHRHQHRALYTCNRCGNLSRNRSQAKDHCLMHAGTTYTCPYCQIVYNHQTSYYNHVRVQHPAENEPCDLCGETFAKGRGMAMHKALKHRTNDKSDTDFICKDCDVKFLNAEALQKHTELFAGSAHAALWPCTACGDSCGSEAGLAAHAQDKHPPDQHYCKECNKTFSNGVSFALHVERKHRNQRAVEAPPRPRPGTGRGRSTVCEICGKLLKNSTLLQYHMNGHLAVKPFQCQLCPKTFSHQAALNLHTRVHTGERPYQCEQCPQAFASQSNLLRHSKLIHLNQRKSVKCDACGKMMAAGSLAPHMRAVHLNQPYRRKRKRDKPLTES